MEQFHVAHKISAQCIQSVMLTLETQMKMKQVMHKVIGWNSRSVLNKRITATATSKWNNEWTRADRTHATTMMKIGAVMTTMIALVVLSMLVADLQAADPAVQHNRNT